MCEKCFEKSCLSLVSTMRNAVRNTTPSPAWEMNR